MFHHPLAAPGKGIGGGDLQHGNFIEICSRTKIQSVALHPARVTQADSPHTGPSQLNEKEIQGL